MAIRAKNSRQMVQANFLKTAKSVSPELGNEALKLITHGNKWVRKIQNKIDTGKSLGGYTDIHGSRVYTEHGPIFEELVKRVGPANAKHIYIETQTAATTNKQGYNKEKHEKLLTNELANQIKWRAFEKEMPREPRFTEFSQFMADSHKGAFLASKNTTINKKGPTEIQFAVDKGNNRYARVNARTYMDLDGNKASAVFVIPTKKGNVTIAGLENAVEFLEKTPKEELE